LIIIKYDSPQIVLSAIFLKLGISHGLFIIKLINRKSKLAKKTTIVTDKKGTVFCYKLFPFFYG